MKQAILHKENSSENRPRLAASFYLNSAPLIWSFAHGRDQHSVNLLTDAAPSRCADMLARGAVEAALVPVIEYQRIPEIEIVPNVCVGARERVQSVVLVTREDDLKNVRTVALDTSSRTSAALVQIIFREFLAHQPQFVSSAPNIGEMLDNHQAALIIGDPALLITPTAELHVYDLASLWRRYTNLGFVFAMWMVRRDSRQNGSNARQRVETIDFAGARDEGLRRVDEIVAAYADELHQPKIKLRDYLLHSICYELTPELQAGLQLFYRLAYKHKLIATIKPLRMVNCAE